MLRLEFVYLALCEHGLNSGPGFTLSSIREQVHDDCTLHNSFVDIEEILSRNPSVLLSLIPGGTVLSNSDDHIQAVVSKVETLSVTYRGGLYEPCWPP